MSQFTEKKAREFWVEVMSVVDGKDHFGNAYGYLDADIEKPIHVIEKSAYDRMKLALEKAIKQRNDYATLLKDETRDTSKWRCNTDECDAEIQKILEGEK